MRFVFLSGGALGFAVAATTSWLIGSTADRFLLNAVIGCLAGALLFRWFWTILLRGLRETILIRQKAAAAAALAGKQP
jgi:hypothetical protein